MASQGEVYIILCIQREKQTPYLGYPFTPTLGRTIFTPLGFGILGISNMIQKARAIPQPALASQDTK